MNSLQTLRMQLNDIGIPYHVEGRRLIVEPATVDGFRVMLIDDDKAPEVHFDSWQQVYTSAEQAQWMFMQGLDGSARLRVSCSSGTPVCWALQTETNGLWQAGPICGKVTGQLDATLYLQNDHVRKVGTPPAQWDSMNTTQMMKMVVG